MSENNSTTHLIKYDAACLALAQAKSVDEVQQIRNAGAALAAYAKIAKNKQLEADAAEIRIRAERRVGQMMAEQKATVGLAPGTKGQPIVRASSGGSKSDPPVVPASTKPVVPTFADAGIDKHLADTARKLAAVPEAKFERLVSDWRENVTQGAARVTVDLLAKKTHVSNNSGENEWYTPPHILDIARNVMGAIDCDPASSAKANETVRANVFYTAEDDGLVQPWKGRVWMNPPYAQPLIEQFIEALAERVADGSVTQAVVLVNNATDTAWGQMMMGLSSAACFLRGRVRFLDPEGNPSGAPLQGQMLCYVGPGADVFRQYAAPLGIVVEVLA